MKFSKEYVNECDCPEIQGLRKELKLYDFYTFEYGDDLYPTISICVDETLKYKGFIWLPTSGQLDEQIVKLNYGDNYIVDYHIRGVCEVSIYFDTAMVYIHRVRHANPLIAKIKLLKQLMGAK